MAAARGRLGGGWAAAGELGGSHWVSRHVRCAGVRHLVAWGGTACINGVTSAGASPHNPDQRPLVTTPLQPGCATPQESMYDDMRGSGVTPRALLRAMQSRMQRLSKFKVPLQVRWGPGVADADADADAGRERWTSKEGP